MLTLLRQIRRSLMQSGANRRYLLYALGEFLLIVAGILVALQINNWNEGRKEHKKGEEYIREIYAQLNRDNRILKKHIQGFETQDSVLLSSLFIYESVGLPFDTVNFMWSMFEGMKVEIVDRPKSVWDDLMNSGNKSILRDDSLITSLQLYYHHYDVNITNHNSYPRGLRYDFREMVNSKSPIEVTLNFRRIATIGSPSINPFSIDESSTHKTFIDKEYLEYLLRDPIKEQLGLIAGTAFAQKIMWGEMLKINQSIISYMENHHQNIVNTSQ